MKGKKILVDASYFKYLDEQHEIALNIGGLDLILLEIQELKRLQKEIDEAEEEMNTITQSSWGLDKPENLNRHFELTDFKESNQAKIKQIIEEL